MSCATCSTPPRRKCGLWGSRQQLDGADVAADFTVDTYADVDADADVDAAVDLERPAPFVAVDEVR